jgi:Right handed beta helix region
MLWKMLGCRGDGGLVGSATNQVVFSYKLMKKILGTVGVVLVLASLLSSRAAFGQGALAPSGPPAASMKTLQQIEPRTLIASLPYTITNAGSYYVMTNLTGVSGTNGITISSGNVTVDLNGFTLFGTASSMAGILIPAACTNVTVRNGGIQGWGGDGVLVGGGNVTGLTLEKLNVSFNKQDGVYCNCDGVILNCISTGNAGIGITIRNGMISGCMSSTNQTTGISCSGGVVNNCVVVNNGGTGILAIQTVVRDCKVTGSGTFGMMVNSGSVINCHVASSIYSGIYVNAPDSQVIGNDCIGNNTINSTLDAGIYVNDSLSRIEGNHVIGSGHAGIQVSASYSKNLVIRNSVSGNAASNYIIPATNDVGPIGSAASVTSPWANISIN